MNYLLGRVAPGRALLFAAALTVAALLAVAPSFARASDDAVQSIGAVPAVPHDAVSLGATPSSQPLKLDIMLSPRDPAGLQAEALAVSTPGSPEQGQYLSVAQVAARYGQTAAAIHSADAALRSMGLVPGAVTANHLTIPVSTTVGQAARSLGSSFASYRLSSGKTFFANTSAPRLPSSLAAITTAVIGLDTLPYSSAAPPKGPGTSAPTAAPAASSGPQPCSAATIAGEEQDGYTYNQLADAYEVNDLYAAKHQGKGVKVGLFEIDPYSTSDLKAFQSCYKTKVPVKLVNVDGGSGGGPGEGEAALDVDTVVAMAPKAGVIVYDSNDNDAYSTDVIDGFTTMFDADKINVVSVSYGLCESYTQANFPGLISSENTLFQQAASEGISAFTASGDTGSEGCARNGDGSEGLVTSDLGSQPFVTSVGGTTLDSVGPAPSETVWNESAFGAGSGGGGISDVWAMPSWQSGPGVDNSYTSGTPCHASSGDCREVPDVSADADPYGGYIIYYDGGWTDIGGTSAASPLWAGLVADILSESSAHRAGFLDPTLYSGAATESGLFNDITVGNNDYGHYHSGAYPATSKYDMASGLGTPIAPGLATLIEAKGPK
jgi:subtilase family serine protease